MSHYLQDCSPAELYREFMRRIGVDVKREGLQDTPARVAKAWEFWLSGYNQNPEDVLKVFKDGSENYDEIVFQGSIPIWSMCEHHMAPFFGVAHIGYLPDKAIVGLSKLSRVADVFARRLQVQERLTQEIATALTTHLKPRAVGVVLKCRHTCIESRGVQKAGSATVTAHLSGLFKSDPAMRGEFLKYVELANGDRQI